MNLEQATGYISTALLAAGIDSAANETKIIIEHVCNVPRSEQILKCALTLTDVQFKQLQNIVSRRQKHEPLQYILGVAPFMEFELAVGPGVLIPRFETEIMVEILRGKLLPGASLCDLGAGSGAIALGTVWKRRDVNCTALEKSPDAISYLRLNRQRLELEHKVEIIESDLFASPGIAGRQFDAIGANLPYVSSDEYRDLPGEIAEHEPQSALLAEENGLALIREALATAPDFLTPNGFVIFEFGASQGAAVRRIAEGSNQWKDIEIITDYNKFDRFLLAFRR